MNCRFMIIMFILYTRFLAPEKINEKKLNGLLVIGIGCLFSTLIATEHNLNKQT